MTPNCKSGRNEGQAQESDQHVKQKRPVGSLPPSEPPTGPAPPRRTVCAPRGPSSSYRRPHREETIVKPRSHLRVELLEDRSVPSTVAAFDLDSPDRGPFPSDRFTVADASPLTHRRINLPLPD